MSRIRLNSINPEHVVICGLDHAVGWFFQVFGPPDEDGEEVLLVDHDSLFTRGYGQHKLIDDIIQYAQDDQVRQHCIDQISSDLDPAIGL